MQIFSDQNELIRHAEEFIKKTTDRLRNVINHCLLEFPEKKDIYATFPAILYCISNIDLLGALYAGNATRNANNTSQTIEYMKEFMEYKEDICDLLIKQFRHKIAHLAEPKPVIEYEDKYIAWKYEHNNSADPLLIRKLPRKENIKVTSQLTIEFDHEFIISIQSLLDDIILSTEEYLDRLKKDSELQRKYEDAIVGIYSYT